MLDVLRVPIPEAEVINGRIVELERYQGLERISVAALLQVRFGAPRVHILELSTNQSRFKVPIELLIRSRFKLFDVLRV